MRFNLFRFVPFLCSLSFYWLVSRSLDNHLTMAGSFSRSVLFSKMRRYHLQRRHPLLHPALSNKDEVLVVQIFVLFLRRVRDDFLPLRWIALFS